MRNRLILHIDLDAFYAQVERARLNVPHEVPLSVQQWSGLIAVNYPARATGVTRHMRVDEAKRLCPEMIFAHVATYKIGEIDFKYHEKPNQRTHKVSLDPYRRASMKIFGILKEFCPLHVQKASVDEAFLDVTEQIDRKLRATYPNLDSDSSSEVLVDWTGLGVLVGAEAQDVPKNCGLEELRLKMAAELALEIRTAIFDRLGFTCSAGISNNKMLSKILSAMNKPNKQTVIRPSCVLEFMQSLSFQKIRSLGGKLGEEIGTEFQVETAGQLWEFSEAELSARLGPANGPWLYNIVRGICDEPVVSCDSTKSMLSAKQFRPPLHSIDHIEAWMKVLSAELYYRLKEDCTSRWPKTLTLQFKPSSATSARSRSTPMVRRDSLVDPLALCEHGMTLLQNEVRQNVAIMPCDRIALSVHGFVEDALASGGGANIMKWFGKTESAHSLRRVFLPSVSTSRPESNQPSVTASSSHLISSGTAASVPKSESDHSSSTISTVHVKLCGTDIPQMLRTPVHNRSTATSFRTKDESAWTLDFAFPSTIKRQPVLGSSSQCETPVMFPDTPDETACLIRSDRTPVESSLLKRKQFGSAYQSSKEDTNAKREETFGYTIVDELLNNDTNAIVYPCSKCGQTLYRDDPMLLQEHSDFHLALDLQNSIKQEIRTTAKEAGNAQPAKKKKPLNTSSVKGIKPLTTFFKPL